MEITNVIIYKTSECKVFINTIKTFLQVRFFSLHFKKKIKKKTFKMIILPAG